MKLLRQLRALFRKEKLDAEMSEEMRAHLELQAAENEKRGLSAREAHYDALRAFGGVEQIKERARDARGFVWLEQTLQDLRYAARSLRKNPGFAIVAILTLGIGIGATTAIFSLLNALLLKPLPVAAPERLAYVRKAGADESFSYPAFERFRDHVTTLVGVASVQDGASRVRLTATGLGATNAESIRAQAVSGNFFTLLGVNAAAGRTLVSDDDQPGAPQSVIVLSHVYWQRRFGGDPEVVGKRVEIDGASLTIVGVAPANFSGFILGLAPEVWWPTGLLAQIEKGQIKDEGWDWSLVIGRLRPGALRSAAQAEMQTVYRQYLVDFANARVSKWSEQQRQKFLQQTVELLPGSTGFTTLQRQLERPMFILSALVVGVLLIACANVAGLVLARGSARLRELTVRVALGAGRGRLARQLATESLLLAFCGGAAGIALTYAGLKLIAPTLPGESARLDLAPDGRVFGFALAVSVLTGILFGLAPALRLSRRALTASAHGTAGAGRSRFNELLVVTQIALSVTLLVAAGLFVRTLRQLKAADLGFTPERAVRFTLDFGRGYNPVQRADVFRRLLGTIETLPAVRSAAVAGSGLLTGDSFGLRVAVDGYTPQPEEIPRAVVTIAGPRFFETLGIALRRGREFAFSDDTMVVDPAHPPAPRVAIVGESFARHFFGEADPIGRTVRFGPNSNAAVLEIIGVAKDVRYHTLREAPQLEIYVPYFGGLLNFAMNVHVAVRDEPRAFEGNLRELVKQIDPQIGLLNVTTLREVVDAAMTNERLIAQLGGFFSTFALTLASLGLYGMLSYNVVQRTREIGVRMALGAQARDVLALVVGQGLKLALLGTAVGVAVALGATRFAEKLLYGVTPNDPLTFAGVAVLLLAVATFAAWLPARRAAKVDPIVALRCE